MRTASLVFFLHFVIKAAESSIFAAPLAVKKASVVLETHRISGFLGETN